MEIVLQKPQQAALWALREGMNLQQAAERAQVARMTLYRWIQRDPHFRAAYNLWQQEVAETARARLLKLSDKAVDAVERQLISGDGKLAVAVLKQLGVLKRVRDGSSVPRVVGMEMEVRQADELRKMKRAVGGEEARLRRARRRMLRQPAAGVWQAVSALQEQPEEGVAAGSVTSVLRDDAEQGEEPDETVEVNSGPERD